MYIYIYIIMIKVDDVWNAWMSLKSLKNECENGIKRASL